MNSKRAWMLALALCAPCAARAATATLDWSAVTTNANGTAITDLFGYRVFYATYSLLSLTTSQAMTAPTVNRMLVSGSLTRAIPNLSEGVTYYFRLAVQDTSGNQSAFSELPDEATFFAPGTGGGLGGPLGPAAGLQEAFCYPNPAVGADPVLRAMMGEVEEVEVTIYDQSGQAVHSGRSRQTRLLNGVNGHEYRWTGEKATGIYYAVIHGKRGDETVRARAKFAVVK
jgi:hypothetical protein